MSNYVFNELSRVSTAGMIRGVMKTTHEDFRVDEIMPVELSGAGEHLWLHVRKTGNNTEWVARQLARWAGVQPRDVGYAGLKDRHGITSQWFSLQLPGRADPDVAALKVDGVEVLQHGRHNRKLKRGTLTGNRFEICLRDVSGEVSLLDQRLQQIKQQGVPNYFGEQRFGHDMDNLDAALRMFGGERVKPHERSLYLSAARSWIFNQVLSARVRAGTWNQFVPGDVLMLDGRSACFADDGSVDLAERVNAQALHPTGPLWGRGETMARGEVLQLEQSIAAQYADFCRGLEKAGMDQERRALRLRVNDLEWQLEDNVLRLVFSLPAGSYATMVLREIVS